MISFNLLKIFFFCLYLIIQIKSSDFKEDYYKNKAKMCQEDEDKETTEYTTELDFALCPCNLHRRLCDYNCCCDPCCDEEDENNFSITCDIRQVVSVHDKFKCQNRANIYHYQDHNALIESHDQVFSLMCIKYDRSKDMGEFYVEYKDNNNFDSLINDYFREHYTDKNVPSPYHKI